MDPSETIDVSGLHNYLLVLLLSVPPPFPIGLAETSHRPEEEGSHAGHKSILVR